jgi:hypothetical protein
MDVSVASIMERNLSSFQTRSDELTTKNSVIVVFNPL